MVFIYNIIPYIMAVFFALVIRYAVPSKAGKWILGTVFTLIILAYFQIQPSYGPKGVVERTTLPEFETKNSQMVDRMLKPEGGDYYDKRRQEAYKEIDKKIDDIRKGG